MYQKYKLSDKELVLYPPTSTKFQLVHDLLKTSKMVENGVLDVIDLGCAQGCVSLKIYDYNPNMNLTLVNYNEEENKKCREIINEVYSQHKGKIKMKKSIDEESGKYDLVLAFAVLHHMIGQYKSADKALDKLTSFVKDYCIIDVPIGEDGLLAIWKKNYGESIYDVLLNLDNFKKYISTRYDIIDYRSLDYGQAFLTRHYFVLRKKTDIV
jgi:hypothetical protein